MREYNFKVVSYDGEQDVYLYDVPVRVEFAVSDEVVRKRVESRRSDEVRLSSVMRSRRRMVAKIYDYARANRWEWFVTWTFDQNRVRSRYDYADLAKRMTFWLNNVRKRKAPDIRYLVVPELHSDGAIHFHGLIADIGNLRLVDSGKRDKRGRRVFNVGDYRKGFTTATRIEDSKRAAAYVTKYITDGLMMVTKNQRRYWVSRNLSRGVVEVDMLSEESKQVVKQVYEEDAKYRKKIVVERGDYKTEIDIYTV